MSNLNFIIDDKHITNEEELHKFILEKIDLCDEEFVEDDNCRGKKHKHKHKKKQSDCKPPGPKHVHLKFMFPYKIDVACGCKQIILGVLIDCDGKPIKNPIVEFELSDHRLGNIGFSPAISFGDGCFCTTFVGERTGCGFIKMCCVGTDLDKVIHVEVRDNNYY